jgi:hypothetical protein
VPAGSVFHDRRVAAETLTLRCPNGQPGPWQVSPTPVPIGTALATNDVNKVKLGGIEKVFVHGTRMCSLGDATVTVSVALSVLTAESSTRNGILGGWCRTSRPSPGLHREARWRSLTRIVAAPAGP